MQTKSRRNRQSWWPSGFWFGFARVMFGDVPMAALPFATVMSIHFACGCQGFRLLWGPARAEGRSRTSV